MKNLVRSFKRMFFSENCPICGCKTDGTYYICDSCYRKLRRKGTLKNQGNYYYLYYYDEDIKRVIADYKLNNRKMLGKELSGLVRKNLSDLIKDLKIEVVIPVPVSTKRYRERGFNQVEELLDHCKIRYQKIYREKDTEHMYKYLDPEKRKKNIADVFRNRDLNLNGKRILIVDDIVTTGTTTREMEKEIYKHSKPESIYVFSLAISKVFKE